MAGNQNMQLVNNWDDVIPPKNESDEQDQESADNNTINVLPDRTKPNRPPETKPDAVGVRPGRERRRCGGQHVAGLFRHEISGARRHADDAPDGTR